MTSPGCRAGATGDLWASPLGAIASLKLLFWTLQLMLWLTGSLDLDVAGGLTGDQRAPRAGGGAPIAWARDGRSVLFTAAEKGRANLRRLEDQVEYVDHQLYVGRVRLPPASEGEDLSRFYALLDEYAAQNGKPRLAPVRVRPLNCVLGNKTPRAPDLGDARDDVRYGDSLEPGAESLAVPIDHVLKVKDQCCIPAGRRHEATVTKVTARSKTM